MWKLKIHEKVEPNFGARWIIHAWSDQWKQIIDDFKYKWKATSVYCGPLPGRTKFHSALKRILNWIFVLESEMHFNIDSVPVSNTNIHVKYVKHIAQLLLPA